MAFSATTQSLLVQIGFMGPALFLSQLSHVKTATGAVACMMASQGLDSFSQSGLYSNHQVQSSAVALPNEPTACTMPPCTPSLVQQLTLYRSRVSVAKSVDDGRILSVASL